MRRGLRPRDQLRLVKATWLVRKGIRVHECSESRPDEAGEAVGVYASATGGNRVRLRGRAGGVSSFPIPSGNCGMCVVPTEADEREGGTPSVGSKR